MTSKLRLRIRAAALRDLADIWSYSARSWGVEQADNYLTSINHQIEHLRERPMLGTDCSHIRPGLRRVGSGSHHLYFRVDRELLEIIRILHRRMDADRAAFEG